MTIQFSKYSGCGNDFILIDNRNLLFPKSNPQIISSLCHRQKGLGADGVVLLEQSRKADGFMRIFNADGSEADMCGNGLRCFVKWLKANGLERDLYSIETKAGFFSASINGSDVRVEMQPPKETEWNQTIHLGINKRIVHRMNTGVFHIVLLCEQIDDIDVEKWGKELRYFPKWEPEGSNVNFVEQINSQKIKIRTFERGVEGETQACGTGAVASALVVAGLNGLEGPIEVVTRSEKSLWVDFVQSQDGFVSIFMSGPAEFVCSGEFN